MSSVDPAQTANCNWCGAVVELAFCEQEECPRPLYYHCFRIALRQEYLNLMPMGDDGPEGT